MKKKRTEGEILLDDFKGVEQFLKADYVMRKRHDWDQMVGRIVRGRGYSHAEGYETIDLYPSIKSYDDKMSERKGVTESGVQWTSWKLIPQADRSRPVQIYKKDVWTVVGVEVREDGLYLLKIVSPEGDSGWTPHFYRLEVLDG